MTSNKRKRGIGRLVKAGVAVILGYTFVKRGIIPLAKATKNIFNSNN